MIKSITAALIAAALASTAVQAQDSEAPPQVLFTNVHVFDGVSENRIENASVLVEGNLIKSVSTDAIDAPDATVIDGGGRTLMPGFVDTHGHVGLFGLDELKVQLAGAQTAEDVLSRLEPAVEGAAPGGGKRCARRTGNSRCPTHACGKSRISSPICASIRCPPSRSMRRTTNLPHAEGSCARCGPRWMTARGSRLSIGCRSKPTRNPS